MRLLLKTKTNRYVACVLLAVATPVFGDVIGTDVQNADGTVTYSYLIDNTTGTFDIAAWSLNFGLPTPDWNETETVSGGSVTVPNANWIADRGTPLDALSAQDFLSLNPGGDVARGQTLAGFSFTSRFQPGPVGYSEFSADGNSVGGETIGPVTRAVPENAGPVEAVALAAITVFTARVRLSRGPNHSLSRS